MSDLEDLRRTLN